MFVILPKKQIIYIYDLLLILIFAIIGRASHSESVNIGEILEIIKTALPFWCGWAIAVNFTNFYTIDFPPLIRKSLLHLLYTLILTLIIASIVRFILLERLSPWTFYLVAFISLTFIMTLGRWLAGFLLRYKN